jgi:GNAT superfamily N-acetyltransferase
MPSEAIEIRLFRPTEAEAVSALVREVFDQHVAPSFSPQGIAEMHEHLSPEAIAERARTHATLVAWQHVASAPGSGTEPVGVIEVRKKDHVSMLFVRTSHMGLGVATTLLNRALDACRTAGRPRMTVNSSLNAQTFYERLGFSPTGNPRHVNGIAYLPMERRLQDEPDGPGL